MKDTNFKNKIFDNFEGSLKHIKKDLLQLDENIRNNEKLDLQSRERILDFSYMLETAIYRAAAYNMNYELRTMQQELRILNTTLNTMANQSNHEFIVLINYKIIALLTFTIDIVK